VVGSLLNKLKHAIIYGPVYYSGRSSAGGNIFIYNEQTQMVEMASDIWTEFCLLGHWIRDAIILRWGELTAKMAKQYSAGKIIELLLREPTTERQTAINRDVFARQSNLECVWSGKNITQKYDIDHVIPFSLWHNNDMWNLLPADPKVNNHKRDSLPSRELLYSRKEILIHYWKILDQHNHNRFCIEMNRLIGNPNSKNWENLLFAAVSQAVDITALQRGIERWHGKG